MKKRIFIQLLIFKTRANLYAEVAQYYFNYLWWVIDPILLMAVLYVVFGIMLSRGKEDFVAFLFIGVITWSWFKRTVTNASTSILAGKGLMQQMNIHKSFFPLEVILRDMFKHLFASSILLIFFMAYPLPITIHYFALPVLFLVQLLFITGAALFCSVFVPLVPDLRFVVQTALHLAFYASGVFFDIDDIVLEKHRFFMYLNPIAGLIKNYRLIMMDGKWPDWTYLGCVTFASLILLGLSLYLLNKFNWLYPKICK